MCRLLENNFMKKTIKAICFDFGGVYVYSRSHMHTWRDKWKYYQKLLGKNFPYSVHAQHQKLLDTGKITLRENWESLFKKINISNPKLFNELIQFKPKIRKTNKNVHKLILKLKKKDFRVILISNRIKQSAKLYREKGYYKVFDKIFLSSEIGLDKSDGRLYRFVLKKLKLKASECVMIDDSPGYIKEARKLGMNVIYFKNAKQVETELKDLGLKF